MAATDGARRSRSSSADGLNNSLMQRAVKQFSELSGCTPEQVTGARSSGEGWSFLVEVVDVERVPTTMSVLATYRVDVDLTGQLTSFERIRRYVRAAVDPR